MDRRLIIFILAAVLAVSCENTIQYVYDLNDGQITILGQFSTMDTEHSLFLSMSYPDRIDSLPGAPVNCYVNGELHRATAIPPDYYEEIDWNTGDTYLVPYRNPYTRYDFQAEFKPGDEVRIEASKGGQMAWAEVIVPQPATLIAVDTATVVKSSVYQDLDGSETYEQEYLEFTARLRDVKGADSYFTMNGEMTYTIRFSSEEEEESGEEIWGPERIDYETFHDLILEDGYSSGIGDLFEDLLPVNAMHCFSDKAFKDDEASVHFYIPSYYFRRGAFYYYDADKIEVERLFRVNLSSIDRSFYNYLRALNNMECYGFDVSPIIEPTMLPGNVNDGYGMVSIAADSFVDVPFGTETYYREDFIYY